MAEEPQFRNTPVLNAETVGVLKGARHGMSYYRIIDMGKEDWPDKSVLVLTEDGAKRLVELIQTAEEVGG